MANTASLVQTRKRFDMFYSLSRDVTCITYCTEYEDCRTETIVKLLVTSCLGPEFRGRHPNAVCQVRVAGALGGVGEGVGAECAAAVPPTPAGIHARKGKHWGWTQSSARVICCGRSADGFSNFARLLHFYVKPDKEMRNPRICQNKIMFGPIRRRE